MLRPQREFIVGGLHLNITHGQLATARREEPPADEREAVAMEFVRQASRNDAAVTDDLRARLARHFTPQEVMEIVLVGRCTT